MRTYRRYLTEDGIVAKPFMSKQERLLRKKLVKLLVDKHHVKYAKRLANFDVNIVPLSTSPDFTAAISFDEGIIYISEGFLQDESTFDQLDMLMRHELSHNLLMHQIRLMHKMGDEYFPHFSMSSSIHDLLNIIEDFEISNTRYTDADKEVVRHTWLNGRVISGLVTEDHRQDWQSLSVEEMFDKLEAELAALNQKIISNRTNDLEQVMSTDFISNKSIPAFQHTSLANILGTPSNFDGDIKDFIEGKNGAVLELGEGATADFKDMAEVYQTLIKDIYNICSDPNSWYYQNPEHIMDIIKEISQATPTGVLTFGQTDKNGKDDPSVSTLIVTPEEKWLAIEVLKNIAKYAPEVKQENPATVHVRKTAQEHSPEYKEIYNKVMAAVDNDQYSDEDLEDLLAQIAGL